MAAPADNPKYAVHLVDADDSWTDQNALDSLVGDGPLITLRRTYDGSAEMMYDGTFTADSRTVLACVSVLV